MHLCTKNISSRTLKMQVEDHWFKTKHFLANFRAKKERNDRFLILFRSCSFLTFSSEQACCWCACVDHGCKEE